MKNFVLGLLLAANWTALSPVPLQAQTFVTNGNAINEGGGCYQLTANTSSQRGSIFSTNTIDLTQPFAFSARFYFGNKDANGADGIVFVLTTTNTALGNGGGGIGYEGITPSIAIEYDDYFNSNFNDPNPDHVAVISQGSVTHGVPTNLVGPINLSNIEDDMSHCFNVAWDPVTQTLAADLDGNSIFYTGDIIANIFSGNPMVHFGFTSGTGSLSNYHQVCFGPPILIPLEDEIICVGESVTLDADPNGMSWTWQPNPTLSALDVQSPAATPTVTTQYIVSIEYACDFFLNDTVIVTVIPEPPVTADNNSPVCEGESVTLSATGGVTYQWSGPNGFSSGQQNPTLANVDPGDEGIYLVTVTDANGCTNTAETEVVLFDPPFVEIDPPGGPFCEDGMPVQLLGTPSGGVWAGEVGANGLFNPVTAGEGTHSLFYTVTDGNGCTNSTSVDITVVPNVPATITPEGPFCDAEVVITLQAIPPGGIWGGTANSDGEIYPSVAGLGLHLFTYMLTGLNECYNTEIFIEIVATPTAEIQDIDTLCANTSAFSMTATPSGGIWGGAAGPGGQINPGNLGPGVHDVYYNAVLTGGCEDTDTTTIVILPEAPLASNVIEDCNPANTHYMVTFTITGGESSSYVVEGSVGGMIIAGNPSTYISNPIPSGSPYSFDVFDANQCDTFVVSGNHDCLCTTQAGNVSAGTLACANGGTNVVFGSIGQLDANDTMYFVIYLDDPLQPLATSATGLIQMTPPLQAGVQYYIALIAGNTIPGVGVDPNDPCLSISAPDSLMWTPQPTAAFAGPDQICLGDSLFLQFNLTGFGSSFDVTFTDGVQEFELESILPGHTLGLLPDTTTTYTITLVHSSVCYTDLDTSHTVVVSEALAFQATTQMCSGDSLFVGGAFQHVSGIYHDTIPGVIGCDTILATTLIFRDVDTTAVMTTTCDPNQAGMWIEAYLNQYGCDSTVVRTAVLVESDTTNLSGTTCDPQLAGITSTLLIGNDGCDSLVIKTLVLLDSDTTQLASGHCDPNATGTFTTILANVNGCDSIIIETISLLPSDTVLLNLSSCHVQDTGQFVSIFQNTNGCDSAVISNVSLVPSYETEIFATTCLPAQAGIFTTSLISVDGCDSLIIENITLLPSDTLVMTDQSCDPSEVGELVMFYTNAFGCDSLVYLVTTLYPIDTCRTPRLLYAPNVFSPNSDGINDRFTLFSNTEGAGKILSLRIYDRWGDLVFENLDFLPNEEQAGWDGKFKGELLNPGVLAWIAIVEYPDGNTDVFVGDVTLLR